MNRFLMITNIFLLMGIVLSVEFAIDSEKKAKSAQESATKYIDKYYALVKTR